MHTLFATPEIAPFTRENPVATDVAALAAALRVYRPASHIKDPEDRNSPISSVAAITPLHGAIDPEALRLARRLEPLSVDWNGKSEKVIVWEGTTPERVRVFFLDHPGYFQRDGVYADAKGRAYKDNAERFGFFARAVVEFCQQSILPVDLIHCHGWTTALIPVYLDAYGGKALEETLTVFSTRDAGEIETFPKKAFEGLDLPKALLSNDALAQGKVLNPAKGGLLFADFVVLPGECYREEALEGVHGDWFADVLKEREDDVFGILTGVDLEDWSPEKDEHLTVHFDADHLNGKRRNKAEVQHIFALPARPMLPLLTFFGPLDEDSGTDVLVKALHKLLDKGTDLQCIVVADGEDDMKHAFLDLQKEFPDAIGLHYEQDIALEHRAIAGADILVAPSRTAPNNMRPAQAMRYGTVCVVSEVGTLGDMIEDWNGSGEFSGPCAPGFVAAEPKPGQVAKAIAAAVDRFADARAWRPFVEATIRGGQPSWDLAAHEHVQMYLELLEG
jgi:starch synthase